jgi:hypothetical protein
MRYRNTPFLRQCVLGALFAASIGAPRLATGYTMTVWGDPYDNWGCVGACGGGIQEATIAIRTTLLSLAEVAEDPTTQTRYPTPRAPGAVLPAQKRTPRHAKPSCRRTY